MRVVSAAIFAAVVGASAGAHAQTPIRMPFMMLAGIPSAVSYDGNTIIVTENSPYNIPSSSQYFYYSYWIRSTTPPSASGGYQTIVEGVANDTNPVVQVIHQTNNGAVQLYIYVELNCHIRDGCPNFGYGIFGSFFTSGEAIPYDGGWHRVRVSIDTTGATPSASAQIDTNAPVALIPDPASNFAHPPFTMPWRVASEWIVGGSDFVEGVNYQGDLAEVYMSMDGHANATPDSEFISGGPSAVGLGLNCSGPTGTIPQLCMRGTVPHFIAGPIVGNDPPAYQFMITGSGLSAATSDPCAANYFSFGCAPVD